jgi:hypothetical protein
MTIMLRASYTQAAQLQLAWDPPTTNTDGTPLGDLAGYKIYYSQSSGNYSTTVDVGNVTSHLLDGLEEGKTYYFAATAYDASGNESDFSNEVSATIPPPQMPSGPFLQGKGSYGGVSMEAENAHANTPQGGHSWTFIPLSGASGTGAMEATPNADVHRNTGYATNSPRLDFQVTFVRTGTHYVWIRGLGRSVADDSVHVGLNGQEIATSDRISTFTDTWTWINTTMDGVRATIEVPTVGTHTVNVWMREDGFLFDKLVLTSNATYIPSNRGPAESSQATTPAPAVATSQALVSAPTTSGATASTTGGLTVANVSTSPTSGDAPLPAVMLWLEAEAGLQSGRMEIGLDDDASSGQYLWVPEGNGMALDPSQSTSEARYTFTVPTADLYVIWGHVRPGATGTGSFFITLDDGASVGDGAGIVTGVAPQHYEVAPVQLGDLYYIDRTYTITAMPDELAGSLAIKTPNGSKYNAEAALLTFTVAQDATLYVAYDARATRYPDWLTASFTTTGQLLQTTDTALMLWKRQVAAGTVVLPGNQYGSPAGVHSNYLILVGSEASGQATTGADYAVWTLPSNAEMGTAPMWSWDQASSDSMPVFFLEPGEHTLRIKQRESGSQLDQLLITNDVEYQP